MQVLLLYLGLFVSLAAPDENLLGNPGFETVRADAPARWNKFVQPAAGARGGLSDQAYRGEHSVELYTETEYAREPINNWSQNIVAGFEGKRLRLSGYIRCTNADEAALWLQCWRQRPLGVLRAATTAEQAPLPRTADWTLVETEIDVPKGTDFITVRCIIKGSGHAWFDDVSLEVLETAVEDEESDDKVDQKKAASSKKKDVVAEKETKEPPDKDEATPNASEYPLEVIGRLTALEKDVSRLRDANVVLADALDQLSNENADLMEQVDELQRALEAARSMATDEAPASPQIPIEEDAAPSPLVPHMGATE